MVVTNRKNQKINTMKTLVLTTLMSVLSLNVFASGEQDKTEERSELASQVRDMVVNEDLFDVMQYSGELSIQFTVDENNQLHVTEVSTDDFSLEYHVRRTLDNVKVAATNTMVGKTISLVIDLVQH